ncbi:MAG: hypothetical protein PHU44_14165 [Syntrophales bacterium]|nr:hypothetical protein [Syntrophales bacterium]MDD5640074.1 hypothetical protein [Syntrophales bacterium]
MKDKANPNASAVQLDQDQESMTPGASREEMIMALNNLIRALNTLRESLLSLQNGIAKIQEILPLTPAPAPVKVATVSPLDLLKKPRILH